MTDYLKRIADRINESKPDTILFLSVAEQLDLRLKQVQENASEKEKLIEAGIDIDRLNDFDNIVVSPRLKNGRAKIFRKQLFMFCR